MTYVVITSETNITLCYYGFGFRFRTILRRLGRNMKKDIFVRFASLLNCRVHWTLFWPIRIQHTSWNHIYYKFVVISSFRLRPGLRSRIFGPDVRSANIMSTFGYESGQRRGPMYHFVACCSFTVRDCWPTAQPRSFWTTPHGLDGIFSGKFRAAGVYEHAYTPSDFIKPRISWRAEWLRCSRITLHSRVE
jgi:hypothetical protein